MFDKEIVNLEEKVNALAERGKRRKRSSPVQNIKEQLDAARNELEQGSAAATSQGWRARLLRDPRPRGKAQEDRGGRVEGRGEGEGGGDARSDRWRRVALDRHPRRQDAEGEREKLLKMETQIAKRVVGQEEAV